MSAVQLLLSVSSTPHAPASFQRLLNTLVVDTGGDLIAVTVCDEVVCVCVTFYVCVHLLSVQPQLLIGEFPDLCASAHATGALANLTLCCLVLAVCCLVTAPKVKEMK